MNHDRLVKALSKVVKVETKEEKWPTHTNIRYTAKKGKYVCSWWKKEEKAECVYISNINDPDDIQSDYHGGWFPKTIKSTVQAML